MKNRAFWAAGLVCVIVAVTLVLDRAVARQFAPGPASLPPPAPSGPHELPPMGGPAPAPPTNPFILPAPATRPAEPDPVREADDLVERLKSRRKEDVAAVRELAQRLADQIESHREALARAERALQAVRAAEAELPGAHGAQYIEGPAPEAIITTPAEPLQEPALLPSTES